jgi:hypothetical protein
MLKTLCYIADRDTFEYIAVSESGRLATRIQNPLAGIPEIEDLERLMQAKLDADPGKEGLAEIVAEIHQYNENVAPFERVRYVKAVTPQLAHALMTYRVHFESTHNARKQQNHNTILDMKLTVVKVEKDGDN